MPTARRAPAMKVSVLATKSTAQTEPVARLMATDSAPAYGDIAATRTEDVEPARTSVPSTSVNLAIARDLLCSRAILRGREATRPMGRAEMRISTLAMWFMAGVVTRTMSADLWTRIAELDGEFVLRSVC